MMSDKNYERENEIRPEEISRENEKLLLEEIGNIDSGFLSDYAEYEKKLGRMKRVRQIRTAVACAACVCIAVGGVIFGAYRMGQSPELPDVTEGSSELASDSEYDTSAETSLYNEEDFVIDENGRLLAYLGNDTEVYIPDTVTEITADALNQSASVDQIVKVHITSSTRHIDEKAFSELDSIEEVEIDEDNEHYYFCNGVLMLSDFSLQIAVSKEANNDLNKVLETILMEIGKRRSESDNKAFPNEFRLKLTKGEFYLSLDIQSDGKSIYYSITSINSFGQTYSPEEPICVGSYQYSLHYADQKMEYKHVSYCFVKILMSDESFWIIKSSPSSGSQTVLVFMNSGIKEINNYGQATENTSIFRFYYDEFGNIVYSRVPYKYTGLQTIFGVISKCVARDEFALEAGYVRIENGEIVFSPVETYTISEFLELDYETDRQKSILNQNLPTYVRTIDEVYEYLRENAEYNEETGYYEYWGTPLFNSLDEFLEYNSTIYARAY